MAKYTEHDPDEWFVPRQGFKWACCDCGLVHKLYTRIKEHAQGRQVEIKIVGCRRSTAAMRRSMKKKVLIVVEE